MKLTRLGHACVRLETDAGQTVLIDPGMFTSADAYAGAQAVLVTHEHVDHFQPEPLLAALAADPALQVWTNSSVAEQLDAAAGRVHVVGHGDAFDLDGLAVEVHGQWHAQVHADLPLVRNIGFLFAGTVFHPGDAYTVPDSQVDVLLLPMHGPWTKTSETVDYVREVRPTRAYPIHDGLLNDIGRGSGANVLGLLGAPFADVAPDGGDVTVTER